MMMMMMMILVLSDITLLAFAPATWSESAVSEVFFDGYGVVLRNLCCAVGHAKVYQLSTLSIHLKMLSAGSQLIC
jgi:hypothetical protein